MEFSFHIIKTFAMWQYSRHDAFNRTKPDRIMKRKIPVTDLQKHTYTVKNASVCTEKSQTFDSPCSCCSRKFSLVKHDSKFSAFFAPFSPPSWCLTQAHLDLKEF